MEKYVVRNIERPDKAIVDELARLGTATVYEAQGKEGLLTDTLHPIKEGFSVCGPAVTVICQEGDNLMIHAAVEVCKPGDVVVITTVGNSNKHGMIGDLIVNSLIEKGVKAIIIESGLRDIKTLREMGLPIWSAHVIAKGTTKNKAGWVNAPAVCGEVLINPGDLIVADDDGICVVRKEEANSTLEKSLLREKKEEATREKIKNGELGVDFYGFRDVLSKLGVRYYDNLNDIQK